MAKPSCPFFAVSRFFFNVIHIALHSNHLTHVSFWTIFAILNIT